MHSNQIIHKRYFSNVTLKGRDNVIASVYNKLQIEEIRAKFNSSGTIGLLLLMIETGISATIDYDMLADGKPVKECIVFGEKLKESTRKDYITLVVNKCLPSPKDGTEQQGDPNSEFVKLAEKASRQTPLDDNAFDKRYQPNGAESE